MFGGFRTNFCLLITNDDSFWRCCIKKKNFVIDVPMNYYYFEQGKPDINLMESTFSANMVTVSSF